MTAIELRTSIAADLEQMSLEMLENVSRYVKRLRRHPRATLAKEKNETDKETIGITSGVARLCTGHSWNVTDEELDQMRYEHLKEKYG